MSEYKSVIDQFNALDTLSQHIKKLGKIANACLDPRLKKGLLEVVIPYLQRSHANAKVGKGTPVQISSWTQADTKNAYNYCISKVGQNRPSWYDAALADGWTPPAKYAKPVP